eukprot:364615-Chlamydomonas_euryale.AAC.28
MPCTNKLAAGPTDRHSQQVRARGCQHGREARQHPKTHTNDSTCVQRQKRLLNQARLPCLGHMARMSDEFVTD